MLASALCNMPFATRLDQRARVDRRGKRLLALASWLYLGLAAGLIFFLLFVADRWWPGTVLMFGPRWIYATPLVVLAPLAIWKRRGLVPLGIASVLLLFGVMRFCVPLPGGFGETAAKRSLRVMTCNVHGRFDPAALDALVRQVNPDILLAQAWSKRGNYVFADERWHTRRDHELFLASRYPIVEAEPVAGAPFDFSNGSLARYRISGPGGVPMDLFDVHLATPRYGLSSVLSGAWGGAQDIEQDTLRRREQSKAAAEHVSKSRVAFLVAGDFNTPTDSTIYRECWSGLTNAFSNAGWGFGYTFFTRRAHVRIDHILAGPGWRVRKCWVGPDLGSPHRPVIADLEWVP